jgi:ribosomal-protein-alanine N-acetyltransferase
MIVSENLIIDHLVTSDAISLHRFVIDNKKRLYQFFPLTLSSNDTLEKSLEYIVIKEKEIQQKVNFTFAIRVVDSYEIIGLIIIKKLDWINKVGELAYCIGGNFEGKGLVTSAVKAISNFAFNELDLNTLQIIAHKTNFGSVKVALNNGFVWSKTLPNEFTPTNELPLDMELYELTK